MSIWSGRPRLCAGLLGLAVAAVLPGCTLPPGGLAQMDGSASAQALQQAEQQGYAKGFAAGELAQALRDKTREMAEAPKQAPPAPPVAMRPAIPAVPDTSLPAGTNYNSSGPAKPLRGPAEPF
ncbi:hypothetical protein [Acidocella sp.]|uniref:hypothetical protein n=1 Tax=Acidocella sp. TaxID=50710 RepID=UPI0018250308|nr:hypothetical protein [Acidocella sp.]NNM57436.1 hypothetical protein [Acidocella sp.]